jgi:putative NADPH-quinone reductase
MVNFNDEYSNASKLTAGVFGYPWYQVKTPAKLRQFFEEVQNPRKIEKKCKKK